jgi:hypothetical protein
MLTGRFTVDAPEHRPGEPLELTLELRNAGDADVFVFVPHGRADGVRVEVLDGPARALDLTREPEPGLVGETRLGPGATHRKAYPLDEWVVFEAPGRCSFACSIELETRAASLLDDPTDMEPVQIASVIEVTAMFPTH